MWIRIPRFKKRKGVRVHRQVNLLPKTARKDLATLFGIRNALHSKTHNRVRLRKVLALPRKLHSIPQRWFLPALIKRGHNIRAAVKNPSRLVRLGLMKKFLSTPKMERPKVIKVSKREVCRARKVVRREIMRRSRGRGIKVKRAEWTPLSQVRCK